MNCKILFTIFLTLLLLHSVAARECSVFGKTIIGAKGEFKCVWEDEFEKDNSFSPERFQTGFIDFEATGQAGVPAYLLSSGVAKRLSGNAKFLKSFGNSDVLNLINREADRIDALARYKFAKDIDKVYTAAKKANDFTQLSETLNTLSRSTDSYIAKEANKAAEVILNAQQSGGSANKIKANISKYFRNNGYLKTSRSTFRSTADKAIEKASNLMKNGGEIKRLRDAGYVVEVRKVQGLKVIPPKGHGQAGKPFEVMSQGIDDLDDIGKMKNAGKFLSSTQAPIGRARVAAEILHDVAQYRLDKVEKLVKKYADAGRADKFFLGKRIARAIKAAEEGGVKGITFENGIIRFNGDVIAGNQGVYEAVKSSIPTLEGKGRAPVLKRMGKSFKNFGSKIAESKPVQALAEVPGAKLAGRTASKALKISAKVLKVGGEFVAAPAGIVRLASALGCYAHPGFAPVAPEVGVSLDKENNAIKYSILPKTSKNADRIQQCLRDVYSTKGENFIVASAVNVANFFDPGKFVEDVAVWLDKPVETVDHCNWAVYKKNAGTKINYSEVIGKREWGCVLDKPTSVSLAGLPKDDYAVYLLVDFTQEFDKLLYADYSNGNLANFGGALPHLYKSIGLDCSGEGLWNCYTQEDYGDCNEFDEHFKCFANAGQYAFTAFSGSDFVEKVIGNFRMPKNKIKELLEEHGVLDAFDIEKFDEFIEGVYVYNIGAASVKDNLSAKYALGGGSPNAYTYNITTGELVLIKVNNKDTYWVHLKDPKTNAEGILVVSKIKESELEK